MAKPFLEPGPTPGTVINSPGELDALVAAGQPGVDHGMTYRKATAPDIATYPIYGNFIWIDTSGARPIKRTYNPSLFTWDAELPADGSITGAMLADSTITLAKIYPTAGLGGYVMRLNSLSNAVVWDAPANLFSANTFAIANLTYSGAGTFVLSSNGSANSWATISSLLSTGDIALSKISTSGALNNQVIYYNGSALAYGYPDQLLRTNEVGLNALELGDANNIPTINAAGTAWEMKTPAQFLDLFEDFIRAGTTDEEAVPTAGSTALLTHGLGEVPKQLRVVMVCHTPENGISANEEVELSAFVCYEALSTDDTIFPAFGVRCNTNDVKVVRNASFSGNFGVIDSSGAMAAATPGNYMLKAYYSL